MHGSLRLVLATLVLLSHLGITLYGYNIGAGAVVVFYLLAGMVSYKLIKNNYKNKALSYYLDRIKRIFPLYSLVLLFSFFVYKLGATSHFLSAQPDSISYLSNITIIPLSYFMYNQTDSFTLLPPAWSLGVELQFYILAPFILLCTKRVALFFLLSFILYILATLGVLHTDYFGYRLIAGVFFMFLLGALIQKTINNKNYSTYTALALVYLTLIIILIYIYNINYKAPYNYETLFALLLGIPLLLKLPRRLFALDRYLGSLSYAVFLVHFPVLWLMELLSYSAKDVGLILFVTFSISIIFVSLENFFLSLIKKNQIKYN